MPQVEEPKAVPPRNDPKKVNISARSRASELSGRDPGFHYEYKHVDPEHPDYYGKHLAQREIGDPSVGFAIAEPWEIVRRGEVKPGRPREDEGKPLDTAIRNGDTVLMRTPKDNLANYREIERLRDEQRAKSLKNGTAYSEDHGGGAGVEGRFIPGFAGNHIQALSAPKEQ